MTDRPAAGRLGTGSRPTAALPGLRVVLDLRPLQEPEKSPTTAAYLDRLLAAFEADPLTGESFGVVLQTGLPDPSTRFPGLPVVTRRRLPPTRLLRSGALTLDPFLLRGAEVGTAWRSELTGARGAVFHTASGAVPLASELPLVVSLLDLAPWELPVAYQRSPAARFGQRLRARIVRDAAAVIVAGDAVARSAGRLLRVPRARLHLVPLAAGPEFAPMTKASRADRAAARADRERLGLPERYLVYFGRYDARQDVATLLGALRSLVAAGRPAGARPDDPWPPHLVLVGATPDDRAELARAAAREDVGDLLSHAPALDPHRVAALIGGARAALLPTLSDATGLAALEAVASGTPVVATAVGALPEVVGRAGILVPPRDIDRLAVALATIWTDDAMHGRLQRAARERAAPGRRTWADVATETRAVYAAAGSPTGLDRPS